jgi:hypothetical protein
LSFSDLNLDGLPDLFVGNGHVTEAAEAMYPHVTLAQPNLCFLQAEGHIFQLVANPGEGVTQLRKSRGVAVADFDHDGDPDLLVNNWGEAPDLLRNDVPPRGRWLRLKLEGTRCNRAAIGARVEVTAGERTLVQEVRSGGSYCSQSDLPLTFGLGTEATASVRVAWPGTKGSEVWDALPADREHTLKEGEHAER